MNPGAVGFIGLGNMGLPMARNLLKAGRRLIVHDINPAAMSVLADKGATAASSPAELAQAVGEHGTVLTMLRSGAEVRSVLAGDSGVLRACAARHASSGGRTLLIDCSTVGPDDARALAAEATAAGCDYLDAPVSGGSIGAEAGTLTFMVGSKDEASFNRARPLLALMGRSSVRCGGVGAGLAAKLANNLALSLQMLGVAEAMQLGIAQGVDPTVRGPSRTCVLASLLISNVSPRAPSNPNHRPQSSIPPTLTPFSRPTL
jgi:3-hydroxyisobutyrate dehydrogenase